MKYKLQSYGVLETESASYIPDDINNPDWKEYLVWLSEGNVADPEFTQTEIEMQGLADKIQELKNEGLSRIQAVMPAISNFDTLELVREMWLSTAPAARQATGDFQTIIDVYQAARDGIVVLKAATPAQVTAYDVLTGPNW